MGLFALLCATIAAQAGTYTDTFGGHTSYYSDQDYYEISVFRVDGSGTLEDFSFEASSPDGYRDYRVYYWVYDTRARAWGGHTLVSSYMWSNSDYFPTGGSPDVHIDAPGWVAVGIWGEDGFRVGYDSSAAVTDPVWGHALNAFRTGSTSLSSTLPADAGTSAFGLQLTFTADDLDADGFDTSVDCDDSDPDAWPGNPEVWYDGVDEDCDGADDYDQDADGHDALAYGGDDCDDLDDRAHPGNREVWYDGVDEDCDGADDYDQDGDGWERDAGDCADTDRAINPGVAEIWYDGVDSDCDGRSDYDADQDGHDVARFGGDDCDDANPNAYTGAAEVWYDGIDEDCLGGDDNDADGDGHDDSAHGGDDCDDTDAAVWEEGAAGCGGDSGVDSGAGEGDDTDGADIGTGGGDDKGAGGCGCGVAEAPTGWLLLAGAAALAVTRRRR